MPLVLSPLLTDALVILGAAGIVIPLFSRFRISPVVGFILVGVLVGPHGLARGAGGHAWLGRVTVNTIQGQSPFASLGMVPLLFAQAARTKSPELFLAAALLVVILAALATAFAGFSPIVGAMLAGLMIAGTDYHHEIESIVAPFRGLGLGIFLITVGAGVDLDALWAHLGTVLAATAALLTVKALVTGVLLRLMGTRPGTAAEVGILLASPSETSLIVLSSALSARLIAPATAPGGVWRTTSPMPNRRRCPNRHQRAMRRAPSSSAAAASAG